MNEHDEIIFNLFIYEFYKNDYMPKIVTESDYIGHFNTYWFGKVKDCFPENEICFVNGITLKSYNYIEE